MVLENKAVRFSFLKLCLLLIIWTAEGFAASSVSDSMPEQIPADIIADWQAQDGITEEGGYTAAIEKIVKKLPSKYKSKVSVEDTKEAYLTACHWRRVTRLEYYLKNGKLKKIIFAKHYNLGGPTPGFIDDLGDENNGNIGKQAVGKGTNYAKGSALCLLEMENYYSRHREILCDTGGVIRDPCAWFDGTKVVFAWSKDNKGYHIYEMPVDSVEKIRQLTSDPEGLTVSDFEPCYLPDSNIIFNSTRSFGFISCAGNINSNLFIMNKDGKYLRRITYDQYSNFSPTIMEDGYVMYSRWEANDRNSRTCFPLMTMNVDGTHQIEYFGNQSTWPATIFQARRAPEGSTLIFAIIGSYRSPYAGELVTIDINLGRNGSNPVSIIAPKRSPSDTANFLTGTKPLFQNPYPLDEDWFLVSWRPTAEPPEYKEKFNIYLMSKEGDRELIAWDSLQSVSRPVSLAPVDIPIVKSYQADYKNPYARITLYNAYYGTGVDKSVDSASWTVKKLRVVAVDLRAAAGVGFTGDSTEYCLTPVSRWLGTRDAKRIIGETPVEKDGSAAAYVPPRTPIYFQLIDANGCVIQSMRSTVSLQPGELFSCYGCHEDKNESTRQGRLPLRLTPWIPDSFPGVSSRENFSFPRHIQPIFNEKCVSCHKENHSTGLNLVGESIWSGDLNDPLNKNAERYWTKSYLSLTDPAKQYVNFIPSNSPSEGLKPYSFGSGKSKLISILRTPPDAMKNVSLTSEEMARLCAWIDLGIPFGGYTDGMKPEAVEGYDKKLALREQHEELEADNIKDFIEEGGYPISVREPRRQRTASSSFECKIYAGFQPQTGRIYIRLPSDGEIKIIDLHGRTVWTQKIDRKAYLDNKGFISKSFLIPKGIYIIDFIGIKGTARQRITVFQ